MGDEAADRSLPRRPLRRLALALSVIALGWLATRTHQIGHDWGDDFALYIRQARSIVEGFPRQVEADNRFSLQASAWSTFSPPIYPWGWPLLMSPLIAIFGVDYAVLKVFEVELWCAALVWWFLIVRARTSAIGAWVLLFALGLSWPFVTWTNSVISDIPYLATAFGALWWMDRCRRHRSWDEGPLWRLVVLGLALCLAFNIRRDGLAVVAALTALLLVQVVMTFKAEGRAGCVARWRRWATPFVVFVVASAIFQMLLPSVLAPRYPDTGLSNVPDRLAWYRDILAEQVGLLRPDSDVISLLGSHGLGMAVLATLVGLAVAGIVLRCVEAPESDLPLAAFGLAHTFIVLVAPFQEGRYLFPIVPVLTYFALQSVPSAVSLVVAHPRSSTYRNVSRVISLSTAVLFAVLAVSSARGTFWWADRATEQREAGEIMNGPERPAAVEMAKAVRDITAPDDVVAFFRARAMTMLTDRRSLQSGSIEPILAGADWYVMERGSTYSQPLLDSVQAEALGLEEVWSNEGWVMFRVPEGARQGR